MPQLLYPWTASPHEVVRLNPASPLLERMWWATLAHPTPRDLTGNLALGYHSTERTVSTQLGPGRRYTRNNFSVQHTLVQNPSSVVVQGGSGWTMAGIAIAYANPGSPLLGFTSNSRLRIGTGRNLEVYISSSVRVASSNTVTLGVPFRWMAWGSSATTYNVWLDGVETSAGAGGFGNFTQIQAIGGSSVDATGSLILLQTVGWDRIQTPKLRQLWMDRPWSHLEPQIIWMPDAPTGAFAVARSEAAALADSAGAMVSRSASITEAISAQDAHNAAVARAAAITEPATAADAASTSSALATAITEATALADAASIVASLSRSITEAATAADTASTSSAQGASITEAASAADAASVQAALSASAAEPATVSDTVASSAAQSRSATEAAALADSSNATSTGDYTRSIAEAAALADAVTVQAALSANIAEAAAAAHTQSAQAALSAAQTETAPAADVASTTASGDYVAAIGEIAAATDTANAARASVAAQVEAAALADTAAAALPGTFARSVTEPVTLADTAIVFAAMSASITEAVALASTAVNNWAYLVALLEQASLGDWASAVTSEAGIRYISRTRIVIYPVVRRLVSST